MKKYVTPLLVFVCTFFFLTSSIFADTINITLPEGWIDFVEDSLPTLIEGSETYISTYPTTTSNNYIIYCTYNFSFCSARFVKIAQLDNINNVKYDFQLSDNINMIRLNVSDTYVYRSKFLSSNNYTRASCSAGECPNSITGVYYSISVSAGYYPVYSTYDFSVEDINSNTYVFTYNDWSYTLNSGFTSLPTLYDLYNIYSGPPAPVDNYPLLTSFYSLVLDKFSLISEEFTSNYIYLAIITIFLLITAIYFLKRRFS